MCEAGGALAHTTRVASNHPVTVGVRGTEWTADAGFFVNGRHVKVRGFCDHNDFGGVGMALADRIHLYKAQALRSVSATPGRRTSHNPPQPAALDIYDRLGVLVMDESRTFGDAPDLVGDMADLVRRDRTVCTQFERVCRCRTGLYAPHASCRKAIFNVTGFQVYS